MKKTKIKICGLRNAEDIELINHYQVDFAGMVLFFPKSRRNITIETARLLVEKLEKSCQKVAVVVTPSVEQVRQIEAAGFDYIQIHGAVMPEIWTETKIPVIRAYNQLDLTQFKQDSQNTRIAGVLFDAASPGSGKTFDWESLKALDLDTENYTGPMTFLAGGLTAGNVLEAIVQVNPDVVDISSGVETAEGNRKDPEKVEKFVERVRSLQI